MKFKKYILIGILVLFLLLIGIVIIEGNKVDVSSLDKYLIESQFYDKCIVEELRILFNKLNVYVLVVGSLNLYYKCMIMMNEYRVKVVFKKNDFVLMVDVKVVLEKIYKEIDEIINR